MWWVTLTSVEKADSGQHGVDPANAIVAGDKVGQNFGRGGSNWYDIFLSAIIFPMFPAIVVL